MSELCSNWNGSKRKHIGKAPCSAQFELQQGNMSPVEKSWVKDAVSYHRITTIHLNVKKQ